MSIADEVLANPPPKKTSAPAPVRPPVRGDENGMEQRLDAILFHLQRMDRRDRLRTWGGFLRSLIALVPLLLFLWSSWYFYEHANEIISKIAEESAKQAAKYTQDQSAALLQQFLPKKK